MDAPVTEGQARALVLLVLGGDGRASATDEELIEKVKRTISVGGERI